MSEAQSTGTGKLVLAGCGYVGERLARRRESLCLARTPARAAALREAGLEALRFDFDDFRAGAAMPEPLRTRLDDAAIVYLAPPPDAGTTDPRLASFLDAISTAQPRGLVYLSTTGVYGDAGGAAVDENTPTAARSDRARRRVDAEAQLQRWCAAHGLRLAILRVPGIYGPGRLPLERLRRREPVLRLDDAGPGNRIHVDDLATACLAALDGAHAGVFNVGDGDHASTTQFVLSLAQLTGLPEPPQITRAEARRRLSPAMLSFMEESRRVLTTAMREVLGVQPRYARHEDGLRASLAEALG
jgi:nucleoside-diphosphate-sugar epimerase